ncbi:hypothetical protein PIB30_021733 [Stylosanthes scabra]|uniref:Uncharacterized protein n=1 Tax=Stylosanthes scabra TaxID=79078 RepID=A0ABU6T976_9FABA|nr:hypothetical protein [Stylosanthes scabra]
MQHDFWAVVASKVGIKAFHRRRTVDGQCSRLVPSTTQLPCILRRQIQKVEEFGCPRASWMSSSGFSVLGLRRNTSASTRIFSVALISKERRGGGGRWTCKATPTLKSDWENTYEFKWRDGEENIPS